MRNLYTNFKVLLTVILLFLFNDSKSSLLISEVLLDETYRQFKYIELTNVSNKNLPSISFSIDNGSDKLQIKDSVGFAPNEVKLIIFPEMTFPRDFILDSTKILTSETILYRTDFIVLKVDSVEAVDTFYVPLTVKTSAHRSEVLVDEEFNPITSEFFAGSPSPFVSNIVLRMKNIMIYDYDNSGNRIQSVGKTIIYDEKQKQPQIEIFPVKDTNKPIKIYPNPTDGDVIVEMPENGNYEFRLNNLQSNILSSTKIIDDNAANIKMSNLPFSIYILSIYRDGNFVTSVKIIKK